MPKADSSVRLPRTRESRPALLGLAILLIVGGALASAFLAMQAGDRAYYVQVNREVTQGARIGADDLDRVSLPEDFQGGIPSEKVDDVVGKAATTRLLPGTVLIQDMIADRAGVKDNQSQVAMQVEASPFTRSLEPGAQLALDIGSSDQEGGGSGESVLAELVSVGSRDGGGNLTSSGQDTVSILVSVDSSCFSTVAAGIRDDAITPALIGSAKNSSVQANCGG